MATMTLSEFNKFSKGKNFDLVNTFVIELNCIIQDDFVAQDINDMDLFHAFVLNPDNNTIIVNTHKLLH